MQLEQYNTYKIWAQFRDENGEIVTASNVQIIIDKEDGTNVITENMSPEIDHYIYFLDTSNLPELGKYFLRVTGIVSERRVSNTEKIELVRLIEEM